MEKPAGREWLEEDDERKETTQSPGWYKKAGWAMYSNVHSSMPSISVSASKFLTWVLALTSLSVNCKIK